MCKLYSGVFFKLPASSAAELLPAEGAQGQLKRLSIRERGSPRGIFVRIAKTFQYPIQLLLARLHVKHLDWRLAGCRVQTQDFQPVNPLALGFHYRQSYNPHKREPVATRVGIGCLFGVSELHALSQPAERDLFVSVILARKKRPRTKIKLLVNRNGFAKGPQDEARNTGSPRFSVQPLLELFPSFLVKREANRDLLFQQLPQLDPTICAEIPKQDVHLCFGSLYIPELIQAAMARRKLGKYPPPPSAARFISGVAEFHRPHSWKSVSLQGAA